VFFYVYNERPSTHSQLFWRLVLVNLAVYRLIAKVLGLILTSMPFFKADFEPRSKKNAGTKASHTARVTEE